MHCFISSRQLKVYFTPWPPSSQSGLLYKFDVKILNQSRDFLLATVLISRPSWDLISEIPCPLLDSAAPWEVGSCSWPYVRYPSVWETDGKPGKTQETFLTGGSCKHRPCSSWWYSAVLVEEKIFLIKSSSAKISRWIFSEGRGGSILHVRNLPSRDCHYYPQWALIQVDFSN